MAMIDRINCRSIKVTLASQLMMRREMMRRPPWKNPPACKDKQNFLVSFAGLIFLPRGASYHVDIGSVIHAFKDGRIVWYAASTLIKSFS